MLIEGVDPEPMCVMSQPLRNVEELMLWEAPVDPEARLLQASVPLPPGHDSGLRAQRPRLLVCHDMMGAHLAQ